MKPSIRQWIAQDLIMDLEVTNSYVENNHAFSLFKR